MPFSSMEIQKFSLNANGVANLCQNMVHSYSDILELPLRSSEF